MLIYMALPLVVASEAPARGSQRQCHGKSSVQKKRAARSGPTTSVELARGATKSGTTTFTIVDVACVLTYLYILSILRSALAVAGREPGSRILRAAAKINQSK